MKTIKTKGSKISTLFLSCINFTSSTGCSRLTTNAWNKALRLKLSPLYHNGKHLLGFWFHFNIDWEKRIFRGKKAVLEKIYFSIGVHIEHGHRMEHKMEILFIYTTRIKRTEGVVYIFFYLKGHNLLFFIV